MINSRLQLLKTDYMPIPALATYDNLIINTFFKYFPEGKVYGKWLAFKYAGISDRCNEADCLVKSGQETINQVNSLISKFKDLKYLENTSKRHLPLQNERIHNQIKIKIKIEDYRFNLIINLNETIPPEDVVIKCNRMVMNRDWKVNNMMRYHKPVIAHDRDVKKKIVTLDKPNPTNHSYQNRYNIFKFIKDVSYYQTSGFDVKPYLDPVGYSHFFPPKIKICHDKSHNCPICMECINSEDPEEDFGLGIILKCKHAFHLDCLEDHVVQIGVNASQCPICRKDIDY